MKLPLSLPLPADLAVSLFGVWIDYDGLIFRNKQLQNPSGSLVPILFVHVVCLTDFSVFHSSPIGTQPDRGNFLQPSSQGYLVLTGLKVWSQGIGGQTGTQIVGGLTLITKALAPK